MEYLKCQICEVPRLHGRIEDCCCDVETVDEVNTRYILPTLAALSTRTYFRYFQVDLWRTCPFWEEDAMCSIRDCAVCDCDPHEIPTCWRDEEPASTADANTAPAVSTVNEAAAGAAAGAATAGNAAVAPTPRDATADTDARVADLSRVQVGAHDSVDAGHGWHAEHDDPNVWTVQDGASPDLKYVNLLQNPEGFTGYAGPSAQRIWRAIYDENCFTGPLDGMCYEERVFYRLISGLQTSINTHIAMTYGDGTGAREEMYTANAARALSSSGNVSQSLEELVLTRGVQPNIDLYVQRIAKYPDRLQNLYFAYLFLIRAVAKAAPLLTSMNFTTGDDAEDAATRDAVLHLLDVQAPAVLRGFDETLMFREEDAPEASPAACAAAVPDVNSTEIHELATRFEAQTPAKALLRNAVREKFRNISRIMDCVGCEKCRLWGKLQFLGVGTAMKILFAEGTTAQSHSPFEPVPGSPAQSGQEGGLGNIHLSRNELVALINVLHRVSMSLSAVSVLRNMEAARKMHTLLYQAAGTVVIGALSVLAVAFVWRRASPRRREGDAK